MVAMSPLAHNIFFLRTPKKLLVVVVYRDEGQLETANPSNECLVDQYRYLGAPYHFNIDSNSFLGKPIAGDSRLQPLSSDSACALMDSDGFFDACASLVHERAQPTSLHKNHYFFTLAGAPRNLR